MNALCTTLILFIMACNTTKLISGDLTLDNNSVEMLKNATTKIKKLPYFKQAKNEHITFIISNTVDTCKKGWYMSGTSCFIDDGIELTKKRAKILAGFALTSLIINNDNYADKLANNLKKEMINLKEKLYDEKRSYNRYSKMSTVSLLLGMSCIGVSWINAHWHTEPIIDREKSIQMGIFGASLLGQFYALYPDKMNHEKKQNEIKKKMNHCLDHLEHYCGDIVVYGLNNELNVNGTLNYDPYVEEKSNKWENHLHDLRQEERRLIAYKNPHPFRRW